MLLNQFRTCESQHIFITHDWFWYHRTDFSSPRLIFVFWNWSFFIKNEVFSFQKYSLLPETLLYRSQIISSVLLFIEFTKIDLVLCKTGYHFLFYSFTTETGYSKDRFKMLFLKCLVTKTDIPDKQRKTRMFVDLIIYSAELGTFTDFQSRASHIIPSSAP